MSEWISVDDRLPPPGFEVQIYWCATRCDDKGQAVASFSGKQWTQTTPTSGGTLWDHLVKTTHWQPLPSPPVNKEEEA